VIAGIIAMMAVANLQYAWTLFTKPLQAHLHATLTAVQWTFFLFILLETWLVPFEGYLVDRIGPRLMLGVGGVLVGLGWLGAGNAESLRSLYFWYALGGIGAGVVYGGTIGNALKWFPDHRGLCVGLVVTAQLNPMAVSYHVDKVIIIFGWTALVMAIEVDRILNGLTRPFWGWVSDHIGRENTMFIAFSLEALAVFALLQLIHRPVWFIALSGLCFFAWGEIFSLFPSITGDVFGKKWATTNYGIVYTAKGVASFLAGPGAAWMFARTGSWTKVFWAMIACD